MPKKREKNAEEFWKGKCRELEKEVRQLRRQLKELQKSKHIYEDIKIDEPTEPETVIKYKKCVECGKGHIEIKTILDRTFEECDTCNYRKKVSK